MSEDIKDVVIIGSGPAGWTAAIYAARAAFHPVVYTGIQPGGQLTTTTEVENFPGFAKGIMGPQLMQEMEEQAKRFGTTVVQDQITAVDLDGPVKTLRAGDQEIRCRAVVISTGATAKTLGLPDEATLMGRGLSTCATCDGFFYRQKKVAVVGGGDSAMEESHYLSKLAAEVLLIHRRDEFRASKVMEDRVRGTENIKVLTPWQVAETLSDQAGLTGLRLKNSQTGETREIDVDGCFYAIGHHPNSEIFRDYVDVDEHGFIVVSDGTRTKTPGVFAAGDIADPVFKQAITAAGMGCQAAMQAQHYLENL